jgi:transcription factor IIIB subunit 2
VRAGRRKIHQLANGLGLGDAVCEQASRLFMLAVTSRFVQGRRTEYVVASCLYVAARIAKTTHMLIDVSDFLHVRSLDVL